VNDASMRTGRRARERAREGGDGTSARIARGIRARARREGRCDGSRDARVRRDIVRAVDAVG